MPLNFSSLRFARGLQFQPKHLPLSPSSPPQLLLLAQIEDLFCFHYSSPSAELSSRSIGWSFFDLQAEYQRMGVPNDNWTMTQLNQEYELCDTYPSALFVPASATTPILLGSSRFRSRGRLPVLSYLHRNKAALCRCSQPLSGFSARCMEDEQMMNCIMRANPNAEFMYVIDTRPKINAMANRAAGKGYENESFYDNMKFHFCPIENIHVMRSSLIKLMDACDLKSPSVGSFLSALESSGWLKHIKAVLDTGTFVASLLSTGVSVLVHCSDGWDRTAQVCSLAQLMLDPYYRTLQGFQALVDKEWISFGHKFLDRCAQLYDTSILPSSGTSASNAVSSAGSVMGGFMGGGVTGNSTASAAGGDVSGLPREMSPIFTQFLDAVWQLQQQFPQSFQFNERFLLSLHDAAHSSQYGTFVGNCEKDRVDLRLSKRSHSFWGYVATHHAEYLNAIYKREENKNYILLPNLAPQCIKFWRGMYVRFEEGVHPRDNLSDIHAMLSQHCSCLEDHIKLLNKKVTQSSGKDGLVAPKKKLSETVLPATPHDTDRIIDELKGISLDWKSPRNLEACSCSTPFDHFSVKYNCWKCGQIFCVRCIDKYVALPALQSSRSAPVCRPCYRELRPSSTSVDSPP
ncbi:unnamed protein product [Cyprideis torosa]|uniref:phosphatidylinositol-3,5-bisphosphate 3-phosphatase n=1 Tax=Cyprideis torosa TaxID=163714 RepID=A0A7R8W5N9_9CRUS|nr:unnamed protein product [Cyprideis torosa]CAG0880613.1 unnamed protein product [Cyprideis torosa]